MTRKEKVMLDGKIEKTQEHAEAVVRKMIAFSNLALFLAIVGAFVLKHGIEGKSVGWIILSIIIFFASLFFSTHKMEALNAEFKGRFNSLQMYIEVLKDHKEG